MNEAAYRQPPLHPLHHTVLRLVGRVPAHDRTFRTICRGSADPDLGVGNKCIGWQRQVCRRRALADAPGGVVDRAMARAEPAFERTLMGQRNAAEMSADADND